MSIKRSTTDPLDPKDLRGTWEGRGRPVLWGRMDPRDNKVRLDLRVRPVHRANAGTWDPTALGVLEASRENKALAALRDHKASRVRKACRDLKALARRGLKAFLDRWDRRVRKACLDLLVLLVLLAVSVPRAQYRRAL